MGVRDAFFAAVAFHGVVGAPLPRKLWSLTQSQVAVTEPAIWSDGSSNLLVTTFNPSGGSTVGILSNLDQHLDAAPALDVYTDDANWPNQASGVSFQGSDTILVAGGFLVPGHGTGEIDAIDVKTKASVKLSTDKSGFFYHEAVLEDMNGDGQQDILTARAKIPTLEFWEKKEAQLLWLEAPDWTEHVLLEGGPDVAFAVTRNFNGDSAPNDLPVIVATQFFLQPALAIYFCATVGAKAWSQCAAGDLRNVTVDASEGSFFNVRIVDMNNDGVAEILATNNRADGKGGVFAYEVPALNWREAANPWTKHVLARGFAPISSLIPQPGQGAPGIALPVKIPGVDKLAVVLSTDDGGQIVQLTPSSGAADDWTYAVDFVVNSTGTVGTPSVMDVDNDGYPELFIPHNKEGHLDMHTWKPETVVV